MLPIVYLLLMIDFSCIIYVSHNYVLNTALTNENRKWTIKATDTKALRIINGKQLKEIENSRHNAQANTI